MRDELDPELMVSLTDNPKLRGIADEATERPGIALDALGPRRAEQKE